MPRFLIKRVWGDVDENFMAAYGRRSREIGEERFPEIVWEHSHVVVDGAGTVLSFCVYQAADKDVLMKHSRAVGAHSSMRSTRSAATSARRTFRRCRP